MPHPATNVAGLKLVPLSLQIPAVAMAALEKAAAKNGFRPSQYALMLFAAAFAARVGIDRQQAPLDRDLDEQVRLVFAHAGQGTAAAIGRAVGMPADRVEHILAAWQHAARHIDTPEALDNDESSPEAGPQAEASHRQGTGAGTLAGREGRRDGEAVSADLPTNSEAKATEDNGATEPQDEMSEAVDSVTGVVSRPDAGGTASATVEAMTVTSSGGENPAPIPPEPDERVSEIPTPTPAPKPQKTIGDLTARQSLVFAELVTRIDGAAPIQVDDLASATGLRWAEVRSAMNTLMGRAMIARSAGRYVLTSRGSDLAAKHLLNQKAA